MDHHAPVEKMSRDFFYGIDWAGTPLGCSSKWGLELRQFSSLMLDSVQPMFVVWGSDKTLLFNNAFCMILGDRFAEALGKPLPQLWKEVWPEIEPYINDASQGRSSLVENQPFKTWASDYEEVRYFTFSYTPLKDSSDKVCGAICIAHDTTASVMATARVREERDRLRDLFNDAPIFLAMGTTPEMRFTYANKRYEDLVGKSGLIGQTVAEILPETEAQGYLALLEEVQRSGKAYAAHDMPYIRPGSSGSEKRFIDFIYQPVFDEVGQVEGILCAGYDVTKQHEAREEAATLRARLEQTARLSAMAHMAATLAHELNQPLAAAMNYLNGGLHALPSDVNEDDIVKTALKETLQQVIRGGEIIKRAREAVARKAPAKAFVDLRSTVQRAVKSSYAAGSIAAAIVVRIDIDAGLAVYVDQVQIEQVLLNLLRNAADAMRGDGFIDVAALAQGDLIVVVVRDTGPGLPPLIKEDDLFVPFLPSGPGMGVGLAISRTIIEAHGGHISAENAPGGGAVVRFTLPGQEGDDRGSAAREADF